MLLSKVDKIYLLLGFFILGLMNLLIYKRVSNTQSAVKYISDIISESERSDDSLIAENFAKSKISHIHVANKSPHPPTNAANMVQKKHIQRGRIRGVIVILTRNHEKDALRKTLGIFEKRFNSNYHYPYVFLNEEPFTDDFKKTMESVTSSKCSFGLIDKSKEWSYPTFIDQEKARKSREDMRNRGIIYGGSESYRFMCRYQSGFFFRHPLLDEYDYYWRVEPATKLTCDVDYDPFEVMQKGKYKYGFTIALHEYKETVPTLWKSTLEFAEEKRKRDPNFNPSLLRYFTDDEDKHSFNGHHFWSNFEIGSLDFLRSKDYIDYFEFLEKKGGFFYERWGDAPVHSLAVGLFLKKSEVLFFEDIGYFHNPHEHCPFNKLVREKKNCECETEKSISLDNYSCLTSYFLYKERPFW